MNIKFQITNPDSVLCTATITMPLAEWKRLSNELESKYPAWVLSNAISNIVKLSESVMVKNVETT
jgi:hypothetical protein